MDYSGIYSKVAIIKERGLYGGGPVIVYPEVPGATLLGAGHQVPYKNETLTRTDEREPNQNLTGVGVQLPPDIVKVTSAGGLSLDMHYRYYERLFMGGMGFEHPDDSPATIVAGAHCHVFEEDHSLMDQAWSSGDERAPGAWSSNDRKVRRYTVGVFKGDEDWVYYGCFVNSFTISGTPKLVEAQVELIPYARVRGSYNSSNWTMPSVIQARTLFPQSEVRMGLRVSGEGGLGIMRVNKFELKHDNKLKADDQTNESGLYIEQPMRGEQSETTFNLEFPRYGDGDSGVLDIIDASVGVDLAAKLELIGAEIASTGEYHKWGFYMSNIRPAESPYEAPVDGAGPIQKKFNFKAYRPQGTDIFAANNYNGVTLLKDSPLVVVCQNDENVNYLLET